MLRQEWKKLLRDRFVWVVLAAFLLGTICMVWIKAEQDTKLDVDACMEAFALYETDREAFYQRQQALSQSLTDWESPEADKLAAFFLAEQQASYPQTYGEQLQIIVRNTNRVLKDYDAMRMKEHSYLYVRQQNFREIYTRLQDVEIEYELVRGWDLYFSYEFPGILAFLCLCLLVPYLLSREREYGTFPVERATPRGRRSMAMAKLWCVLGLTAGVVIAVNFCTLLPLTWVTGFSSLSNSAHVLTGFVYLPLDLTVGELLLLSMGLKLLVALTLAGLLFLLYTLTRSYYGTVLLGVGTVFADLAFLGDYGILYLSSPMRCLEIYDCFNFFTYCMPTVCFACVVVLLCGIFCITVGTVLFPRREGTRVPVLRRSGFFSLGHPRTLFGQECRKLWFKQGGLWLLIAVLVLRWGVSTWQYTEEFTVAEHYYREYMEIIAGEYTPEKDAFIVEEIETQKRYADMAEETISTYPMEEQDALRQKIMAASYRITALERIARQAVYVRETEGAFFVSDTDWNAYLDRDFDYLFYAALVLMLSGILAREKDLGAHPTLAATRYGRGRFYRAKTLCALAYIVSLYVSCALCDLWVFYAEHDLPGMDFPAQSLSALSFSRGMTLGGFLGCSLSACLLTALLAVPACVGISALISRTRTSFALTMTGVFVPFLVCKTGFAEAGYVAVSALASPASYPILTQSYPLWGTALLLFAVLCAGFWWYGGRKTAQNH